MQQLITQAMIQTDPEWGLGDVSVWETPGRRVHRSGSQYLYLAEENSGKGGFRDPNREGHFVSM